MKELHERSKEDQEFIKSKRKQAHTANGALSGAAAGALAGSVVPIVGTTAGAITGSIIGMVSAAGNSGKFDNARTYKELNEGYVSEVFRGLKGLFRS